MGKIESTRILPSRKARTRDEKYVYKAKLDPNVLLNEYECECVYECVNRNQILKPMSVNISSRKLKHDIEIVRQKVSDLDRKLPVDYDMLKEKKLHRNSQTQTQRSVSTNSESRSLLKPRSKVTIKETDLEDPDQQEIPDQCYKGKESSDQQVCVNIARQVVSKNSSEHNKQDQRSQLPNIRNQLTLQQPSLPPLNQEISNSMPDFSDIWSDCHVKKILETEENPYKQAITHEFSPPTDVQKMPELWSILTTKPHFHQSRDKLSKLITPLASADQTVIKPLSDQDVEDMVNTFNAKNQLPELFKDRFQDVRAEVTASSHYKDEEMLAVTYLGPQDTITRKDHFVVQQQFPLSSVSRTTGFLLDGTRTSFLFDTGATKCYMSKKFYDENKSLHHLPKFSCDCRKVKVGSGELIKVFFAIPVMVNLHGHLFELFALVTNIEASTDIVWGIKNMYETEGVINTRNSSYEFMNRSLPFFPRKNINIRPKQSEMVDFVAPFYCNINKKAVLKIRWGHRLITKEVNVQNNSFRIQINNTQKKPITLCSDEAFGVLDLRSCGYYKVDMRTLQDEL